MTSPALEIRRLVKQMPSGERTLTILDG